MTHSPDVPAGVARTLRNPLGSRLELRAALSLGTHGEKVGARRAAPVRPNPPHPCEFLRRFAYLAHIGRRASHTATISSEATCERVAARWNTSVGH